MTFRIGPRVGVLLVAAAFVSAELGLRATGRFQDEARFEPSERYGHRMIGGQERFSPRGVPVHINSLGFRDREWTDADATSVRIAVLGDSVSFGQDVAEEAVWCRLLETSLRSREASSGRRIVVQNFSVPGYGIEQSARVFEDFVAPTRPAVVILTVAPYRVRPLQVQEHFRFSPVRRWMLRTAIVQCVQRAAGRFEPEPPVVELRREAGPIGDPLAPENVPLWEAAFARIEGMRRDVERWGGRLALMSVPPLDDFFVAPPASRFAAWSRARENVLWIDPTSELTEAMEPLLREMREHGLGRTDVWRRYGPGDARPAHSDSALHFLDEGFHLSPYGHRSLAQAVEHALRKAGLP